MRRRRNASRLSTAVLFLAWTSNPGRTRDLAAAVGGQAVVIYPLQGTQGSTVAARYLLSGFSTFKAILRARPATIVVQSPPVPAAIVGAIAARVVGARLVLDVHPGGFGLQGDELSRRLRPISRHLIRRAAATLVTDESLARLVRSWGGSPLVVHEAPPTWSIDRPPRAADGEVLLVGTFARDEPIEAACEAAQIAGVPLAVTGDVERAPLALRESSFTARLTDYLVGDAFVRALEEARAVLVLTTEPASVPRAGYEAVRALRPLVISDTPATRATFPAAIHTTNTPEKIAAALKVATGPIDEASLRAARDELERRWRAQLSGLRDILNGTSRNPPDGRESL